MAEFCVIGLFGRKCPNFSRQLPEKNIFPKFGGERALLPLPRLLRLLWRTVRVGVNALQTLGGGSFPFLLHLPLPLIPSPFPFPTPLPLNPARGSGGAL